jgi:hypothetical protein
METGYVEAGDTGPYLCACARVGHAIPFRLGDALREKASELQADCLAGATLFGAAADGNLRLETGDKSELVKGLGDLADKAP